MADHPVTEAPSSSQPAFTSGPWADNASLLAAAPALYEALAEVRYAAARQLAGWGKGIEPSERLQEAFDAADKALAKARGEA